MKEAIKTRFSTKPKYEASDTHHNHQTVDGKKHVSFSERTIVTQIPSHRDLDFSAKRELWWSKQDYVDFRFELMFEDFGGLIFPAAVSDQMASLGSGVSDNFGS